MSMFRKVPKTIKVSAKALQILSAGANVVESVKNTYLVLAAKMDGVPDGHNYEYNHEKSEWVYSPEKK